MVCAPVSFCCAARMPGSGSMIFDEQTAIDDLVGHAHALVAGISSLQPSGNLLRRPVQHQFTGHDQAQLPAIGRQIGLRPQRRLPGLLISLTGRYTGRPPCRATSEFTVDAGRSRPLAISRIDEPDAMPREMSSRSANVSVRGDRRRTAGAMPPCFDSKN